MEHEGGDSGLADAIARSVLEYEAAPPETLDGVPKELEDWFRSSEQGRYIGLSEEEAVAIASEEEVTEVRVFYIPLRRPIRLDHKPERLNLAIADGQVTRAAFFQGIPSRTTGSVTAPREAPGELSRRA